MTQATIGAVSTGTLCTKDLLRAYRGKLSELDTGRDHTKLIYDARITDPDSEEALYIVDELADALQEFAPDYVYFGSLEGDGACFGFWPDIDGAREDGCVYGDLANAPAIGQTIIVVNDHGNATCYVPEITWREIWSVV